MKILNKLRAHSSASKWKIWYINSGSLISESLLFLVLGVKKKRRKKENSFVLNVNLIIIYSKYTNISLRDSHLSARSHIISL